MEKFDGAFQPKLQRTVCVSAPGKVILHGEHSVVYGRKAIACGIGSRITITTTSPFEDNSSIAISMPALHPNQVKICIKDFKNVCEKLNDDANAIASIEKYCADKFADVNDFMRSALSCVLFAYYKAFLDAFASEVPSLSLLVKSQLPIGAGLGSSAAFNTSVACVFLIMSGKVSLPENGCDFESLVDKNDLNKISLLAFAMEKIVHKTPSGIDNSIATFGGAVSFQNGTIKRIERMPKMKLLIVDTCVPRSTKNLVAGVREYLDKYPNIVNPILDAMHNIAMVAEDLLQCINDDENHKELLTDYNKLIVTNQCLLSSIGVSHPALDQICAIAKKYGFPAKLTGAGGGGCAIILLNHGTEMEHEKLNQELISKDFVCREADLGGPGILLNVSP